MNVGIIDLLKRTMGQVIQSHTDVKVPSIPKKYGTHGRLEIQELSISVPVYDHHGGDKQQIVDDENSAVFMDWGTQQCIADHNHQNNFSNLNRVRVGKTIAILDLQTKKNVYRCSMSQVGHIRLSDSGNRLFDSNWEPVYPQNAGGLCIYTCIKRVSPDTIDVRLTYWRPVNVEQ